VDPTRRLEATVFCIIAIAIAIAIAQKSVE
jgi:hypothetical protein